MMEYDIFKIHQYRETDTTQNNQQGYINKEGIMPRHHQWITQIAWQCGKTRITKR
jgi:hypothetical protein